MEKKLFTEMTAGELASVVAEAVAKALAGLNPHRAEGQKLLTVQEAGLLMRVSKSTLWLWRRKGLVKARYLGRRVYFDRDELMGAAKRGG